ncbi:MAG: hypothetical protein IJU76_15465, partial [Desulfovibrionaceae bacterium]|nr:hypothetical protein [Desulfovibrionaceae bacterium]
IHHKITVTPDHGRDISRLLGQLSYGITRLSKILLKKKPIDSLQFPTNFPVPCIRLHHISYYDSTG